MQIERTAIHDVLCLVPQAFEDDRGSFMETWNLGRFREAGLDVDFVQDCESCSIQGVLRGLHFQIRQPQGKLVRVANGEIFDIAVDLRRSSPTFGRWAGAKLSCTNRRMLWVPPGCAHGFLVLSEGARVLYKMTAYRSPAHERCIAWDDPELGIPWPLAGGQSPLLTERDRTAPRIRDAELYA